MLTDTAEISVKGKFLTVPAICVDNITVIVVGKWIKTAIIKDETWQEGVVVGDPENILKVLNDRKPKTDIFTFSQKLPDTEPKYNYPYDWDNVAAISITTYENWWKKRLSKWTRKNVRRAVKRGVVIKKAEFNKKLINGIVEINNETPFRTGRPFWHYGKSFDQVKKDYSDFQSKSEIYGAYFNDELIGILKLVYMGKIVSILQILCKNTHYDKRPANALIAKAVEVAANRKASYLIYGKYIYDENENSSLTEFKRRNGFEKFLTPTYYVPLSVKGKIIMFLDLHLGIKRLIPKPILYFLLKQREKIYKRRIALSEKTG